MKVSRAWDTPNGRIFLLCYLNDFWLRKVSGGPFLHHLYVVDSDSGGCNFLRLQRVLDPSNGNGGSANRVPTDASLHRQAYQKRRSRFGQLEVMSVGMASPSTL